MFNATHAFLSFNFNLFLLQHYELEWANLVTKKSLERAKLFVQSTDMQHTSVTCDTAESHKKIIL